MTNQPSRDAKGDAIFTDDLKQRLSAALPAYLPTRRWYGDKARSIQAVHIVAMLPINAIAVPSAFAVIEVRFAEGDLARYVLPISLSRLGTDPAEPIAVVEIAGERAIAQDALMEPAFRTWLLRLLVDGQEIHTGSGHLRVDRVPTMFSLLDSISDDSGRVLGVEQSNSSIVFGRRVLVKIFRRLQFGVNPDVELTRFLTVKAKFESVPQYLGSITYEPEGGEPTVVAVAQSFVESVGDSWQFMLELIRQHVHDPDGINLVAESVPVVKRLGEVTAGMHVALASDPWTPDVAPETIRRVDAELWSAAYLGLLDTIVAGVQRGLTGLDARSREFAETFLEIAPGLRMRTEGFERLIGRQKTRVHGDYHLGQTLRTTRQDFAIIDFEGEPQRSMDERRRKTSPLKDVAGMLRSFNYARGTAAGWLDQPATLLPSDLVTWERAMRREFLRAYVDTAIAGGADFLPRSPGDLQAAVAAWELDKAAYEVQYELNNRPDWLWIPISAMLKQGQPER